jgi:RimJ/RimL family protein N-acetyltransferase
MTIEDAEEFHKLRTQPEVMIKTSVGKVDIDLEATRTWINRFIAPNDETTWVFAIEELANPGAIIGTVGSHLAEPPTIGYMLRSEAWGKGYATEALKGCLQEYWKLPRKEIELQSSMFENKLINGASAPAKEVLLAEIELENVASVKVIEKCGFIATGSYEDVEDWRGPARLLHYVLERPEA